MHHNRKFDTESPSITLGRIKDWLQSQEFDAIGVATFGPVDANKKSPTYGYITSTPKPGWNNTDVLGLLGIALSNISSLMCYHDVLFIIVSFI